MHLNPRALGTNPRNVQPPSEVVLRVFDAWKSSTGRNGKTLLDPKRQTVILRALKLGYDEGELLDAVRGWSNSPFHRGENDRHKPYNDLGLLLRDAAHIERFRDLARTPVYEPDANDYARGTY